MKATRLTKNQKSEVIEYLASNRKHYATNKDAFEAALKSIGAQGVVSSCSANCARYVKLSEKRGSGGGALRACPPAEEVRTGCVLTAPGVRFEFSAEYLPAVMHTIAVSMGDK